MGDLWKLYGYVQELVAQGEVEEDMLDIVLGEIEKGKECK